MRWWLRRSWWLCIKSLPFRGGLEGLLNVDESGIIDIFDISGVRVGQLKVSGGITSNAVDISTFSNGVYMYYLHTNQQYAARGKIVIAH